MSILGLYSHMWWDAPDIDEDDDQDDQPMCPPDILSVSLGVVWWSDAPILTDDD